MRAKPDIFTDETIQDPLTETQRSAISCLLECHSIQTAAEKCSVDPRTLSAWLQSPAFSEELTKARRHQFDQVTARLQSAANDAAETLMRLLKCGNPLIELRAAKIIVQTSQKSLENAETETKARDLKRTNTLLEGRMEALKEQIISLQKSKTEFLEMTHSLITGTFKRPEWITQFAWDKIVRSNHPIGIVT